MGPKSANSSLLATLDVPIVQAPMAGGPSTPELAVAVDRAGGLGFLAAGYLTPDRLERDIATVRRATDRFGVNVFVPGGAPADPHLLRAYAELLRTEADRASVELGTARFDDDSFEEKLAVLMRGPAVAVVSFTFGLPPTDVIRSLRSVGSEVWVTVTSPSEALDAVAAGADALVVQGVEAGGHRGVFVDDDSSDLTLLAALQLVRAETDLPLVAAGAIMTGRAIAAVLAAGASAAQIGTALLLTPEAGTSEAQRQATSTSAQTVLTRAFSGRLARGIVNRFHETFGVSAPHAYPEVNHLTSPLRAHGRAVGDSDLLNLWAGEAHSLARAHPAEVIVRELAEEARAAIAVAASRLAHRPND